MTVRKRIIAILESGPLTLRDISVELQLKEKEVLDHLQHVSRSVAPSRRIHMAPARCEACGYVFRKRARFSTPGKCPLCRSQRILPPEFTLRRTDPHF